MSIQRLTVTRWTADGDPDGHTRSFELVPDGSWELVSDGSLSSLEGIMSIETGDALRVDSGGTIADPDAIAAALPRSARYDLVWSDFDTGVSELDEDLEGGGTPVMIDGERWAAFPLPEGSEDQVVWLRCDPDEMYGNLRAAPATRRPLAWASGIELRSHLSGPFKWSLKEVDDKLICFITDPDDDATEFCLEERHGRTDLELVTEFAGRIGWEPVALAAARAIELRGKFNGTADELDPELSGSCEVQAEVRAHVFG